MDLTNRCLHLLFPLTLLACAGSEAGSGSVRFDSGKQDGQVITTDASRDGASFDAGTTTEPDAMSVPDATSAPDGSKCGACVPNETQSEACDCGTGSRMRRCSAECQWLDWGECTGGAGYPKQPGDVSTSVCPPYDRPAVFFAPHPDDESLGMGGAIAEHVAANRAVFIELMTHGEGTGVRSALSDGQSHAWHNGTHNYALSATEIGEARVAEFLAAAASLGVDGVFVSDFGDGNLSADEVASRVAFWTRRGDEGLSLKGTVGAQDPRSAGGTPHPDHAAVWAALGSSGHSDIRGYLVYHHTANAGTFTRSVSLGAGYCTTKRAALDAYKFWNPANGRYAVGYHSTAALFDATASTCVEYLVVP